MSAVPTNALSEQLARLPATTRSTVQAARRLVGRVAPRAEEISYQSQPPRSARSMWKLVRYAVGGENVVGIGAFSDHVNVFFYRGLELDDPRSLLAGSGKQFRSITLRAPADADRPEVKRLVQQAFKLAG
jgi:hypothetical protein